jgi:hypothetical protein
MDLRSWPSGNQHLQDAHPQSQWDQNANVGPDRSRICIALLAPNFFGSHGKRLKPELGQRDLREAFLLEIPDAPRRHHLQKHLRIEQRLDEGISKRRMSRRDRRCRLG